MAWLVFYLLAGVITFFSVRVGFAKLKIDAQPHDRIWTFCCGARWDLPESWLAWGVSIVFWPLYALASLCWLGAELFHLSGKREVQRREAIEAKRDKKYDQLTLDQKLELLEAEARRRK